MNNRSVTMSSSGSQQNNATAAALPEGQSSMVNSTLDIISFLHLYDKYSLNDKAGTLDLIKAEKDPLFWAAYKNTDPRAAVGIFHAGFDQDKSFLCLPNSRKKTPSPPSLSSPSSST